MTFENWVKAVKKTKGVDVDGAYGKQCVDLYLDYCDRVLGLPHNMGAACAKKILNNKYAMKQFTRINNYAAFVPKKGDVCVWASGTYGHVAICLGQGNTSRFKVIEQNWQPLTLTEGWHNYTYMAPLVFLRPKNQTNIVTTTKKTTDKLNLREKPTTKAKIILEIPKGKSVKILEDDAGTKNGYEWSKAEYLNYVGYVAKEFLK